MVAEDAVQQLALRGLKCSVRIDEVLDANQGLYVLPPAAAKEVEDMCFEFCRVDATLVLTFHRATPSVALFNCTMQNHYLMHFGSGSSIYQSAGRLMLSRRDAYATCKENG